MTTENIDTLLQETWNQYLSNAQIDHNLASFQMHSYSQGSTWTCGSATADKSLFCASAFKGFVLAECLRQVEQGLSLDTLLTITDDVRSPGGTFCALPSGEQMTLDKALDAMIGWSDNTATDMILGLIGADQVRELVNKHGLLDVVIPDSTRRFMLQLYGVEPKDPDPGWKAVEKMLADKAPVHSPFEISERMAAPASAFVRFYTEALGTKNYLNSTGKMESILATSEPSQILKKHLNGASAIWLKGGRLNLKPYHVFSSAGRLQFGGDKPPRWLNFAIIVNKESQEDNDTMFKAFIGANVEMLNLVINKLPW